MSLKICALIGKSYKLQRNLKIAWLIMLFNGTIKKSKHKKNEILSGGRKRQEKLKEVWHSVGSGKQAV